MAATVLQSGVLAATKEHTATVIFMHGLGDKGHLWQVFGYNQERIIGDIRGLLPHVKFIFPHAPIQPVTLQGGMSMPSWFDIFSSDKINGKEDREGMLRAVNHINELITEEMETSKLSSDRIVVAGFSQGAAMALLTGLTSERKLAGMVALSGYLPLRADIFAMATDTNKNTPIFMAHGDSDVVVNYQTGKGSAELLKQHHYQVDFNTYEELGHSAFPEELQDLAKFFWKVLPEQA
ncbi:hypothetical protein IWQ62_003072 [Dispira parvispora]|uniref:Acyl-protein thioesterase 1 n=1 Tax=Dispira parvispora TaxID=1520584 RepID=A0A9W8AUU8_9FUNG|nr:hypothetical protein IWQ62_003072 [Dispira parvispora]